MLLIFALIAQGVFFLGVLFVSARSTIKKGSILRGTMWFYGLSITGLFLFCVAIPALLISLGVDKHTVVHSFPESIAIMPAILVGWFVGLAFAALVRAAHVLANVFRRKTGEPAEGAG
jgi:hypothetical protein